MTQKKRVQVPRPKPGMLEVKWGRPDPHDDPALCYVYGGGGVSKPDGHMLSSFFERLVNESDKTLAQELEARGYDLTTLKFSVAKKAPMTPSETG